jgi:hypothetical protein
MRESTSISEENQVGVETVVEAEDLEGETEPGVFDRGEPNKSWVFISSTTTFKRLISFSNSIRLFSASSVGTLRLQILHLFSEGEGGYVKWGITPLTIVWPSGASSCILSLLVQRDTCFAPVSSRMSSKIS